MTLHRYFELFASEIFNLTKNQRNWGIGIAMLIGAYIIGSISEDKKSDKVYQIYTHPGEGYGVDENGEVVFEVRRNYDLDGNPLYDDNDQLTIIMNIIKITKVSALKTR